MLPQFVYKLIYSKMKKIKVNYSALILLLVAFGLGCSDLFKNENSFDGVSATIENEELVIVNNLDEPMYFLAADQNLLAAMLWAPRVTDGNEIQPGKAKTIPLSEVGGYTEQSIVVVYYWDKKITEIFNIVLE
jgi:hypothetical protein